eukprot:2545788-Karenia_brevis.AAC.1
MLEQRVADIAKRKSYHSALTASTFSFHGSHACFSHLNESERIKPQTGKDDNWTPTMDSMQRSSFLFYCWQAGLTVD